MRATLVSKNANLERENCFIGHFMSYDIESIVSECDICSKFRKEHQRELLIPHDIPNARFYKIGVDIMTFKSVDYLAVVDYFTKFPEMLELPDSYSKVEIYICSIWYS